MRRLCAVDMENVIMNNSKQIKSENTCAHVTQITWAKDVIGDYLKMQSLETPLTQPFLS